MENSENCRQSLIPTFLYSSAASSPKKVLGLNDVLNKKHKSLFPSANGASRSFVVPAPNEPGKIEMYSPAFYAACTAGGILSCGLTHMAVTPLDLVKCNMQVWFCLFSVIRRGLSLSPSFTIWMIILMLLFPLGLPYNSYRDS